MPPESRPMWNSADGGWWAVSGSFFSWFFTRVVYLVSPHENYNTKQLPPTTDQLRGPEILGDTPESCVPNHNQYRSESVAPPKQRRSKNDRPSRSCGRSTARSRKQEELEEPKLGKCGDAVGQSKSRIIEHRPAAAPSHEVLAHTLLGPVYCHFIPDIHLIALVDDPLIQSSPITHPQEQMDYYAMLHMLDQMTGINGRTLWVWGGIEMCNEGGSHSEAIRQARRYKDNAGPHSMVRIFDLNSECKKLEGDAAKLYDIESTDPLYLPKRDAHLLLSSLMPGIGIAEHKEECQELQHSEISSVLAKSFMRICVRLGKDLKEEYRIASKHSEESRHDWSRSMRAIASKVKRVHQKLQPRTLLRDIIQVQYQIYLALKIMNRMNRTKSSEPAPCVVLLCTVENAVEVLRLLDPGSHHGMDVNAIEPLLPTGDGGKLKYHECSEVNGGVPGLGVSRIASCWGVSTGVRSIQDMLKIVLEEHCRHQEQIHDVH